MTYMSEEEKVLAEHKPRKDRLILWFGGIKCGVEGEAITCGPLTGFESVKEEQCDKK